MTLPVTPTFPATPLDLRAELLLSGTWTDVTSYLTMGTGAVTIGRGHPDESTTTSPSTTQATFNNRDARFSGKNPAGPYYGQLGRNVPLRLSVPEGASYLRSDTDQASYASCPDSAGVSITGDTEIQLDITLSSWRQATILAAKFGNSGQFSWLLSLQGNGTLFFSSSPDGAAQVTAASTVSIPNPPGGTALRRCAVKVTLAVATGTVTFWTAPDIGGTWTQLGAAVVSGATSVFDSTAPVTAGWTVSTSLAAPGYQGKIHAFRLLSGIGGTVKASPDFTTQTPGATSFTDAQSNTWTVAGTAEISNRKYRLHAECSAWPQKWDPTGTSVTVAVTAGGLLRRLTQGSSPLSSALYRAYVRLGGTVAPVAYWPCEDGSNAARLASALGGQAMSFTGAPSLAGFSGFACSNPIPLLSGSTWTAAVPAYSGGTDAILRFLMAVPSTGAPDMSVVARMYLTGTIRRADLLYHTGGALQMLCYDGSGGVLEDTGSVAFGVNGKLMRVGLELRRNGTGTDCNIETLTVGAAAAVNSTTLTLASSTAGMCTMIVFNPAAGVITDTAIGHVSLQSTWDTLFDLSGALAAWQGEAAGNRFRRLCGEEGITFRGIGDLGDTTAMGPQATAHLTALLQECADADRGIEFEPRQVLGLGYRTRVSMLNQAPAVTLAYTQLAADLLPTEDDQFVFNDITATQASGSFSQQVLATGPLSVQAPPAGIGRYDTSVTVNLAGDSGLDDVAGWILHMSTVNEPRYPAVNVDLATTLVTGLFYDLQEADLGDRIVITGTPAWLPPDGIDELIQGIAESLYVKVFTLAWACVPRSPWAVSFADDPVYGRADTDGSALHAGITSAATSMTVDTTAGFPLWTTAAADFPFDVAVGGERITVTNITGSSSPQAFTVTRSVNGVVKAHSAGEDIRLFFPAIIDMG